MVHCKEDWGLFKDAEADGFRILQRLGIKVVVMKVFVCYSWRSLQRLLSVRDVVVVRKVATIVGFLVWWRRLEHGSGKNFTV